MLLVVAIGQLVDLSVKVIRSLLPLKVKFRSDLYKLTLNLVVMAGNLLFDCVFRLVRILLIGYQEVFSSKGR